MKNNLSKPQAHDFPMIRSGGLFLLCVGLGMLTGTLLGGNEPVNRLVFFIGTGLGFAALFSFGKQLSYGPPTRRQMAFLIGSILVEVILLSSLSFFVPTATFRDYWLWTLLVVGIHFLPMSFAFGPRMAVLGFLCLLNACIGLWLGNLPFIIFGMMDGFLKIGFGLAMFLAQPAFAAQSTE